jgi:hypothetical protein
VKSKVNNNSLPFNENLISERNFLRFFSYSVPEEELKWHHDPEDRLIKVLNENDWLFQFDNTLPQQLPNDFLIPMGVWHRLIKGTTNLQVQVTKLPKI